MIEVNVNTQMNFNFCVVFTNYALKICLAQMLKNARHKLSRILELRFKEAYNREKMVKPLICPGCAHRKAGKSTAGKELQSEFLITSVETGVTL